LNYDINDYKKEKNTLGKQGINIDEKNHIAEVQPLQGCFSTWAVPWVAPTVIEIKLFQSFM